MSVQPLVAADSPVAAPRRTLRVVPEAGRQRATIDRSAEPMIDGSHSEAGTLRLVRMGERRKPIAPRTVSVHPDSARPMAAHRTASVQRTGFDIAFNVAAVAVIALALLVLGIVLAIVSSPEVGAVASAQVHASLPEIIGSANPLG
ncbi:hypothetical protein [Ancrocorticia sp.]|uniref:hypothetical protein n=1 Tax=Ancrocorticia sp. TaxID=2593684 RepID=UPI003F8F58C9